MPRWTRSIVVSTVCARLGSAKDVERKLQRTCTGVGVDVDWGWRARERLREVARVWKEDVVGECG